MGKATTELYEFLKPLRKDQITKWAWLKNRSLYILLSPLGKREILKLANETCQHYHTFVEHPACFFGEDSPRKEKIGILDLETFTFNFRSDMGIVMSYTIKELDGKLKSNWATPKELHRTGKRDLRLVKDLIKDMTEFDRLVGHNTEKFDFTTARSQAVHYGLEYPIHRSIYSTDTLKIMWKKFNLKSASLRNACKYFEITAKDTPFEFELWLDAVQGDKKAMKKVVKHCEEDVVANETLFKKISPFVPLSRKSI